MGQGLRGAAPPPPPGGGPPPPPGGPGGRRQQTAGVAGASWRAEAHAPQHEGDECGGDVARIEAKAIAQVTHQECLRPSEARVDFRGSPWHSVASEARRGTQRHSAALGGPLTCDPLK